MGDLLGDLEKEYCPPIDSALFYAIISDFDLLEPSALQAAKQALDQIKVGAEAEEYSAFDPSGSSNAHDASSTVQGSTSQARSWNGERATSSDETDMTSIATSIRSPDFGDFGLRAGAISPDNIDSGIDLLSIDGKVSILSATFPDLKPFDIGHVLTRCGDDVERAIDELLNQTYLKDGYDTDGERHAVPKGVDGFAQNPAYQPKKKGKGKRRKKQQGALRRSSSTPDVSSDVASDTYNKWTSGESDIKFIVERINLPYNAVKAAYNKANYSLRATIQDLGSASLKGDPPTDEEDAVIQIHTSDLSLEFPFIQTDHIKGIVKMSYPSTASAHDLAKALVTSSSTGKASRTIEAPFIPQYVRPNLQDEDSAGPFTTVQKTKARRVVAVDGSEASLRAQHLNAARTAAYAQATAAYRRSRSQPLMAAAAGYYASVGREAAASAEAYSYTAADALVSQQASVGQIDLHGVDVKNAIQISSERVQSWWGSGRAEWARQGKVMGADGFRIVTGVGRHSQGGKAVLGPAIRKALVAEGWRIDEEPGVLTVRGRARRS